MPCIMQPGNVTFALVIYEDSYMTNNWMSVEELDHCCEGMLREVIQRKSSKKMMIHIQMYRKRL